MEEGEKETTSHLTCERERRSAREQERERDRERERERTLRESMTERSPFYLHILFTCSMYWHYKDCHNDPQ